MKVTSYLFRKGVIERTRGDAPESSPPCQLIIGFAQKELLRDESSYQAVKSRFPEAEIVLCSTAGEIFDRETYDDAMVLTAVSLEKSRVKTVSVNISDYGSSFEAAEKLIGKLDKKDLRSIFILSDGSLVNGSELVRGIRSVTEPGIPVTGGLAGDGTRFESTVVGHNAVPKAGIIAAVGFYGPDLRISHGTMGGWEMFGLERTVTRSASNVLYEIDDKNALELYKNYLGKYADDLPRSALLFPLYVTLPGSQESVVRTILSINNDDRSMVFAGDVPVGSKVRFMRANFDKLVDAASTAAQNSLSPFGHAPKLAILISCVGRKVILDKRVDEEVDAVMDIMGQDVVGTGFYSYGEISPLNLSGSCQLHNQTMTITTFDEV